MSATRARSRLAILLALAPLGVPAGAQQNPAVRRVREAYQNLEYDSVVAQARRTLDGGRLARADAVELYELLGFSYGALDSTARAVEMFRELIRLDPDREPDVNRVSPRLTALYASALGQVTVIRRLTADSVSFVAGQGSFPVRFQVSRPARVVVRVVGPGLDSLVDSLTSAGLVTVDWRAVRGLGTPVADGRYYLTLEATSGRDVFESRVAVDVRRGAVDTVLHLLGLPGYTERPEMEQPPRSWAPLGLSALLVAVAGGGARALEHQSLGGPARTGLLVAGGVALASGFINSLRRPEPRQVEASVLYNRLLQEQLAQRNADISRDNAALLRQTVLVVVPVTSGP